ncbi:hypothetical protein CI109_106090 [Kwoniella shandongensis]|uniref:Uncharacterized protein n=1 Tax=Kwoniella shandongensis TaxID=1734106 RepID=A0A5M6BSZ7_9TREE|nr:uncharacterized protein CI109_006372 [Kwoniella shandongensis]KAA5525301.1 hypothetical protein CI109_006372 [Kwoniella shandongensis]
MSSFPPPPPFLPAPPQFDAFPSDNNGYDYRPPTHTHESRDNDRYGGGGGGRRDERGGARGGSSGGGRGRSPDGRGKRRLYDRDNRSIEERVQNERICRTLFVRNVSYDADPEQLRVQFATYGQIKTFYEMVHNRGMIFITYFDLRAAERARDGMHGHHVGKRSIDVHYSLPRADDQKGDCDREKNQGSIMVYVHPPRVIHDNEVGRLGEQCGEIKSVRPGREPAQKIVEFYDSRGAALFVDRMNGQPGLGGTLDLRFVWDELDNQLPPPPAAERVREPNVQQNGTGYGARGPRRSGEGPGYGDVRSSRGNGRGPPGGGGGSGRQGRGRSPDRGGDRRGSYPTGAGLPPPPGRYGDMPPSAPPPDDRLEQARKVQQLLASLGGGGGNQPGNQPTPLPSRPPVAPPPPPSRAPYPPQQDPYPPRSEPYPPRRDAYPPRESYPPPRTEQPYPARQEQQYPPRQEPPYPPRQESRYPPRQDAPYPPPRQDQQYAPPPVGGGGGGYQPPPQTTSYAPYAPPPAPVPQVQPPYPPAGPPPSGYPPYPPQQQGNPGLPPDVMGMLQRNGPPPPVPGPGQYGGRGPPPPPATGGAYDPRSNGGQGYAPQQNQQAKDVGSLLAMLVAGESLRPEDGRM